MNILVCIKRVPDIAGSVTLDDTGAGIDESGLGHTMSSHEECAVELAIQTAAATGGTVTVLTLGPAEAVEQLRAAVAVGANDGILVEAASVEPAVIIAGIGLNVSLTDEDFADAGIPDRSATSMITAGATLPDTGARADVAAAEITHLLAADAAWRGQGADLEALRRRYRELSATLGTRVRAELPDGTQLTGTAVDLGEHGELVIDTGAGQRRTVTAGDVVHLRPTGE